MSFSLALLQEAIKRKIQTSPSHIVRITLLTVGLLEFCGMIFAFFIVNVTISALCSKCMAHAACYGQSTMQYSHDWSEKETLAYR